MGKILCQTKKFEQTAPITPWETGEIRSRPTKIEVTAGNAFAVHEDFVALSAAIVNVRGYDSGGLTNLAALDAGLAPYSCPIGACSMEICRFAFRCAATQPEHPDHPGNVGESSRIRESRGKLAHLDIRSCDGLEVLIASLSRPSLHKLL